MSPTGDEQNDCLPEGEVDDDDGGEFDEDEAHNRRACRSDSTSSHESIKMLHDNLRRESRGSSAAHENEYDLEALHGVVQTLYEEQESLLNAHMTAIQESAELLTEEGALLAGIQGDNVVDYDIDRYVVRLDEILAQKAATIAVLQEQLAAFRKRCEEEENVSRKIQDVPRY
ncbi:hypothetical protein PINS_up003706 [Pythium insidiosum]|nr:hypothetical protein PINS_up003706 [Pythium insidiosum]